MQKLGSVRLDRAAGVLLGQACGDALGVPYEFNPPMPADERAFMKGSHVFGPGEWSDDTELASASPRWRAPASRPLRAEDLDAIAQRFLDWGTGRAGRGGRRDRAASRSAACSTRRPPAQGSPAERCRAASCAYTEEKLRTTGKPGAGNGALMRTGILALVYPFDRDATADLVRRVAGLTHVAPDVEDTCVLWTEAVRAAMLRDWGADEALAPEHLLAGLDLIPEERRTKWEQIVDGATGADPASFGSNGWTVKTFQAAWAAITSTPVPLSTLRPAASRASTCSTRSMPRYTRGWDTDTVAAVAASCSARVGAPPQSPPSGCAVIRGRGLHEDGTYDPGMRARDLVRLAVMTVKAGADNPVPPGEWPRCERVPYPTAYTPREAMTHPADDQVRVGGVTSLEHGCDAAVSLCRVGRAEPLLEGIAGDDRVESMLIDDDSGLKNRNLHFMLDEGARAACQLRHEGHRVLIHCVNAESRSPSVAARYGVLRGGTADGARQELQAALDAWRGRAILRRACGRGRRPRRGPHRLRRVSVPGRGDAGGGRPQRLPSLRVSVGPS